MAGLRWRTWLRGRSSWPRCCLSLLAGALGLGGRGCPAARRPAGRCPGVVGNGGQPATDAFGSWRGRPLEVVTVFTGTSTWDSITGVAKQGLTKYWDGSKAHVSTRCRCCRSTRARRLCRPRATGAYNSKYASVAQQLVAGGDGDATIRLGWEMTGDWYTWSGVKDPAAYAGAFRQAVTAMRAVSGAHFTFDWNVAMGFADPEPMYPGDAYVDFIGADNYDSSWAVPVERPRRLVEPHPHRELGTELACVVRLLSTASG